MKRLLLWPLVAILASACRGPQSKPPDGAPPSRTALSLQWRPVDNLVGRGKFFHSALTLENQGPGVLGASGRHPDLESGPGRQW
jgi:hypothetical protein